MKRNDYLDRNTLNSFYERIMKMTVSKFRTEFLMSGKSDEQ